MMNYFLKQIKNGEGIVIVRVGILIQSDEYDVNILGGRYNTEMKSCGN